MKSQEEPSLSSPGWLRAKMSFSPPAKMRDVSLYCLTVCLLKHTESIFRGMTGVVFPSLNVLMQVKDTEGSFCTVSVGGKASPTYLFPKVQRYAQPHATTLWYL